MQYDTYKIRIPKLFTESFTKDPKKRAAYSKALDLALGDLHYLEDLISWRISSEGRKSFPSSWKKDAYVVPDPSSPALRRIERSLKIRGKSPASRSKRR